MCVARSPPWRASVTHGGYPWSVCTARPPTCNLAPLQHRGTVRQSEGCSCTSCCMFTVGCTLGKRKQQQADSAAGHCRFLEKSRQYSEESKSKATKPSHSSLPQLAAQQIRTLPQSSATQPVSAQRRPQETGMSHGGEVKRLFEASDRSDGLVSSQRRGSTVRTHRGRLHVQADPAHFPLLSSSPGSHSSTLGGETSVGVWRSWAETRWPYVELRASGKGSKFPEKRRERKHPLSSISALCDEWLQK